MRRVGTALPQQNPVAGHFSSHSSRTSVFSREPLHSFIFSLQQIAKRTEQLEDELKVENVIKSQKSCLHLLLL